MFSHAVTAFLKSFYRKTNFLTPHIPNSPSYSIEYIIYFALNCAIDLADSLFRFPSWMTRALSLSLALSSSNCTIVHLTFMNCFYFYHSPSYGLFSNMFMLRVFTEWNWRNWTWCREIKMFRFLSTIESEYEIDFSLHGQIIFVPTSIDVSYNVIAMQ